MNFKPGTALVLCSGNHLQPSLQAWVKVNAPSVMSVLANSGLNCFTGWQCGALTWNLVTGAPFSYPASQVTGLSPGLCCSGFASGNTGTFSGTSNPTALLVFSQWCHCCSTRLVFSCGFEEHAFSGARRSRDWWLLCSPRTSLGRRRVGTVFSL